MKVTTNKTIQPLLTFPAMGLLLLAYLPSFQASWHFDDVANILLNNPLHLSEISFSSIKATFFAYPEHQGKFLRPISNLSFSLNWFFGQDNVFGYHLVNFAIHLLTSMFLYQSCLLLLSTPKFANSFKKKKYIIAAMATAMWAFNPVQTQAITYIVQRMASLSTLFSMIGIWSYLKARLQPGTANNVTRYLMIVTFFSFLFAIGSKENAILLPASLLLIEVIFFQKRLTINRKSSFFFCSTLVLIASFTLLLAGPGFFQSILSSYQGRDFTLFQRLLTEGRIVVFYLSLLFFPSPDRLSITHDIQYSSSIFNPANTLSAILFLSLLILFSLTFYRKYPLTAFAILFFLLNHLVESSIIPLELIFEHRNYLPSSFLFLPIAAALEYLLSQWREKNRLLHTGAIISLVLLFSALAFATYTRNKVWISERSLWQDSMAKAPQSRRSYINLAHSYLVDSKDYKKAFELNYLSLDKQSPTPWKDKMRAYNTMGYIMTLIGNYEQGLIFFAQSLEVSKAKAGSNMDTAVRFMRIKCLWLIGKRTAALADMADLVNGNLLAANPRHLLFYGEMLAASNQLPKAQSILGQAIQACHHTTPDYGGILLTLSLIEGKNGNLAKSTFFAQLSRNLQVVSFIPYTLCRLEHHLLSGNKDRADRAMQALLSQMTWPALMAILNEKAPDRPNLPLDFILLRKYSADWLTAQSNL